MSGQSRGRWPQPNCRLTQFTNHAWQVAAALAGGSFELGDRVACLRGTGSPPLAARGTVVGEQLLRSAAVCLRDGDDDANVAAMLSRHICQQP